MSKFYQGKFTPQYPEKYVGDVNNIVYRSSWELKFLIWCDRNVGILKYGSEELVIPYFSTAENKARRYFPDFIIMYKHQATGQIRRAVIEIKPYTQTMMPKVPKRQTRRYLTEVKNYVVNTDKWHAAKSWCDKNGFEFQIFTEYDLGISKRPNK